MPKVKIVCDNNNDSPKGVTTRSKAKTTSKEESSSSSVLKGHSRTRAAPASKTKSMMSKRQQKKIDTDVTGNKENLKKNKSKKSSAENVDEYGLNDHNGEIVEQKPKPKRRIIIPDDISEDSGDDYEPDTEDDEEDTSPFFKAKYISNKPSKSDAKQPPKKKPKITNKNTKKKGPTKKVTKKDISLNELSVGDVGRALDTKSWAHLKYEFLQPDKIRDKNQRSPSDPDYDPTTLYIPPEFLDSQTPFMHQWWLIKADHFDCVVLFRFGNFYHLFHMDGVIGATELNLTLMDVMKKGFAHTACSGMSYGRIAGCLLERGYKIARVEQTETQEMANQRISAVRKLAKLDKLIKREVCQITSKGTKVYHPLDTEQLEASSPASVYLLSIVENSKPNDHISTYGVCFIDTTIGIFNLGQFEDDQCNSRLLTMLTHYPPAHIVYERGNLTTRTLLLLKRYIPGIKMDALEKGTKFWPSKKTLQYLHDNKYFKSQQDSKLTWPKGLNPYLRKDGSSKLTAAKENELAVDALGGCIYLLKEHLIDQQLLAQGMFQTYTPSDFVDEAASERKFASNMVLDAMTMNNLNVFGTEGSLFEALDYCCTPFGKRLLRGWICRPSCCKSTIIERQKATVELLDNHGNVVREVRGKLKQLPDLERMLSKIHAQGNENKFKNHPDGRAVIFDKEKYIKRTIIDFIITLDAFETVLDIIDSFSDFKNILINQCTKLEPEGDFPDLRETLNHFKNAFNHEEAKKEGLIIPKRGVDKDYDANELEFAEIRKELYEYLGTQRKLFGLPLEFVGTGKRFQIEIPDSHVHKVGMEYEFQGSRKGFKRYYTPKTRELLAKQLAAEKHKDKIMEDINRKVFAKFSSYFEKWSKATYNVAVLDCLISLAKYARACKTCCIPQIYDDAEKQGIFIDISDGVHPCIYSDNFVPNDTQIGVGGVASLVILTGPNMGGKSTLMRQVGLITIMAQIGYHVPASSCRLTLVDRIFTRLGASDDIIGGQSTFLVELTETSVILLRATKYSLVLLDELGRGTSTYDGTAIAASVVEALTKTNCRTLFSTHYHSLVDDYKTNNNVTLAHMACVVENDGESEVNEQTVSFLYKLTRGACPKSYGFNAARLAGVPPHITKRAHEIATRLETEVNLRNTFTALCRLENHSFKSLLQRTRKIFSNI